MVKRVESCSVFGMGIQLLQEVWSTVRRNDCLQSLLVMHGTGAQQRIQEHPLPVYVVLLQYMTESQMGPQNISRWTCFRIATLHTTPSS